MCSVRYCPLWVWDVITRGYGGTAVLYSEPKSVTAKLCTHINALPPYRITTPGYNTDQFYTNIHHFYTNTHQFYTNTHQFYTNTHQFYTNTHQFYTNIHHFYANTHQFYTNTHQFYTVINLEFKSPCYVTSLS
jgi:hypothetical protein